MATRIRVLELCDGWSLGGTALDYFIRATHLDATLFHPLAVGFDGGPWLDACAARGLETRHCALELKNLEHVFADFRPQLVHYLRMASLSPLIVATQQLCRKYAVAVEVETNMFGRPARDNGLSLPTLIRHVSQASMLRYAELAGKSVEQLYQRGDRVIYLPILASRFDTLHLTLADRESFRRQFGIRGDEVVACRIGRADMRKWSQRLEYALPRMLEAVPNLRYIFQTAPAAKITPLQQRFGDRVLNLPMTSSPEELARLYHASDLMVHSSAIGESFGCSLAEGMFWGLPIVVDSTPDKDNAQIELVDHEQTGLVVTSASGFIQAVCRLAKDSEERNRLGRSGKAKASRLYSEQCVANLWEKRYIELLDRAGVSGLTEDHRNRARQVEIPEEINEIQWPNQYRERLTRHTGPSPDLRERLSLQYATYRDLMTYAKESGPTRVWNALKQRLVAGRLFRRA